MIPRSTHQAQTLGFDIQQMMTQQRRIWDGLFNVSPKQKRTVHQDPDELGFWVENYVCQKNVQERTIHQDPDKLGFWFENA